MSAELERELEPKKALARLWMMIASGRSDLAKAEPDYQTIESALARAQNPDGVRVVEACHGNPGAGGCVCYCYGDMHDDWCHFADESVQGVDAGTIPDWCPLRSSPVLLRLKDGV